MVQRIPSALLQTVYYHGLIPLYYLVIFLPPYVFSAWSGDSAFFFIRRRYSSNYKNVLSHLWNFSYKIEAYGTDKNQLYF